MSNQLTAKQTLKSEAFLEAIGNVLPKHVSADRMSQIYITAITKIPQLAKCDQASLLKCLMSLSAWGLEPDGYHAHLIPFNNRKRGVIECQLILDYKGIVELVYRAGQVSCIHADVVRKGDRFIYSGGKVQDHLPHFLNTDGDTVDDPEKIIAAYCVVEFKDGATKTELMSVADIEAVRKRSRAGNSGPWSTDFAEMAKKTVFKRAAKWLPISAEIVDAFQNDFDRRPAFSNQKPEVISATAFESLLTDDRSGEPDSPVTDDQGNGE